MDAEAINQINDVVCRVSEMNNKGLTPVVWTFPTGERKGGYGFTHVQPIVESFIVSDWWTEHEHLYYIFASCKQYNTWNVRGVLEHFGMEVVHHKFFSVGIKKHDDSIWKRVLRRAMRWLGVQKPSIFFTH